MMRKLLLVWKKGFLMRGRCHMFYGQRVVDITDGLPKWTGMNGKSDLIEDSPPEEIKKRKREIEKEENGNGEPHGKSVKM
jgi:hypothetical protein